MCPRLTRAIHKALCLRDRQRAADPRSQLCLLHFLLLNDGGRPLGQERHFAEPVLNEFIREVVCGRKRELHSSVSLTSYQQESAWEVLLRPGSLPSGTVVVQCVMALMLSMQQHSSLASQQLALCKFKQKFLHFLKQTQDYRHSY